MVTHCNATKKDYDSIINAIHDFKKENISDDELDIRSYYLAHYIFNRLNISVYDMLHE